MKKTALITGITGQDGAYLAQLLLSKGYIVYGGARRSSQNNLWRLKELNIADQVKFISFELNEFSNIMMALEKTKVDEIYNLGAQSFVGASFEQPIYTGEVDGLGVTRILEAIRILNPKIKFYQASTSEMFGKVQAKIQSEDTPFYPRSPYGVAKLYGHWIAVNYRESYNIHTSSGILFNHESPLRGEEFVTRKITLGLANIVSKNAGPIKLGNLDAKRDWGYAKDYVEGMWLMLQQEQGDDYVLATGKTFTIRYFIEIASKAAGFNIVWQGTGLEEKGIDKNSGKIIFEIDSQFYRPAEVDLLLGDATKAEKKLNWKAKTSLENLAIMMVEADLKRINL
jgi:GDPmannose 4,6-dehydratase